MGKRDNRYAFVNPIAAARSQRRQVAGPTLTDYFNRERMSWEEVKALLDKRKEKTNSLAAFEDHDLHLMHKAALERRREKLLAKAAERGPTFVTGLDVANASDDSDSSSDSDSQPSSSSSRKRKRKDKKKDRKKRKKRKKSKHRSDSDADSDSDTGSGTSSSSSSLSSDGDRRKRKKKRKKHKKSRDSERNR